MGNIFPRITNLKESPQYFEKAIKLIEKSFHYKTPHSFKIDFAPLMDESNFANCFVMIDENENVIAHVGAKDKSLFEFPVTMLGGIAVDESRRGEGHFQTLLQDVMAEKRSDTSLFLLWSDQEKLYNKFGFHLCGTQFEAGEKKEESHFVKTKYHLLSHIEQNEVKELYKSSFAKAYLTLTREEKDWEMIGKITSADLHLKKDHGRIQDYFFTNKGQDLPDIIYEYGTRGEMKDLIETISSWGKVWMGRPIVETENLQYQFFMAPGDLRLFTDFIRKITQDAFSIRNVNQMKQEVYFDFNGETLMLSTEDFLRGVFGPGTFEELELPTIFLSGLDSI